MTMATFNQTALQRLDSSVEEGTDYTEWEPHFFSMQELCCTRYAQWLKAKGVSKELSQEFPLCLEVYLAFVYQHGTGELKQVSSRTLKEFLMNFLPHKVMVEPAEYISWLPALKLFYMFLGEKRYLNDSAAIMKILAKVEPGFLRFVKKQS